MPKHYAIEERIYGHTYLFVVPEDEIDWQLCAEQGREPDEVVNTIPADEPDVWGWCERQDRGEVPMGAQTREADGG
jgi:hypothetical protein